MKSLGVARGPAHGDCSSFSARDFSHNSSRNPSRNSSRNSSRIAPSAVGWRLSNQDEERKRFYSMQIWQLQLDRRQVIQIFASSFPNIPTGSIWTNPKHSTGSAHQYRPAAHAQAPP